MNDEFRVSTRVTDSDQLIVSVAGELDAATGPHFSDAVAASANGESRCVIDLSEATFMDASGIRAVLECRQRMEARGATLTLAGVHGEVEQVLQLAGLDGLLTSPI